MKRILYIASDNLVKGTGFSQRIKRQMEIITQIDDIKIDLVNTVSIRDLIDYFARPSPPISNSSPPIRDSSPPLFLKKYALQGNQFAL